jgi:hypothetical protein
VKLFWHIGPHKTGTSSIEIALARQAATGNASYYYPPTPEFGPGHAVLAWRLLGLNKQSPEPDAIRHEIDRAKSLGFSKMVISSEEFSRALLLDQAFEPMARICDEVECELILTLRPITERVYPEIQELIKNGMKLQFSTPHDLLNVCDARPGLRADFLPAAINGSRAAAVSVIMVDEQQPLKLFETMSLILGETIPAPPNPRSNVSLPLLQAIWLESVNRFGNVTPAEARSVVETAFAAGSKQSDKLATAPYPPLPPVLERYLTGVWDLQVSYLRALEQVGRIRCL